MPILHLICKDSSNMKRNPATGHYTTGSWDLREDDAAKMVGGTLFLHAMKNRPSFFGGEVISYALTETGKRVVFTLAPTVEAKGVQWRAVGRGTPRVGGVIA